MITTFWNCCINYFCSFEFDPKIVSFFRRCLPLCLLTNWISWWWGKEKVLINLQPHSIRATVLTVSIFLYFFCFFIFAFQHPILSKNLWLRVNSYFSNCFQTFHVHVNLAYWVPDFSLFFCFVHFIFDQLHQMGLWRAWITRREGCARQEPWRSSWELDKVKTICFLKPLWSGWAPASVAPVLLITRLHSLLSLVLRANPSLYLEPLTDFLKSICHIAFIRDASKS